MGAAHAASGERGVTIRLATPNDFQLIQELFSVRDERAWDRNSVEWSLFGLAPERCVTWLAFDGDRAVGLSAMFLRNLQWEGHARRVGYWANLYILPTYRQLMIYPRLPLVMFDYIKRHDIAFVYCAVRLRDLASAHLRIGFAKLGEVKVLFKPLRPVRLLAKARQWPQWARTLGKPLDAAWEGVFASSRRSQRPDISIAAIDGSSPNISDLVAMLNDAAPGCVLQRWTERIFAYRYCRTREGGHYQIFVAQRRGRPAAAVIYRQAERGAGIAAGVVVDVIATSMSDPAVALALAEAHEQASNEGCDLVIYLNGLGSDAEKLIRSLGYRDSPEIYEVLVWPRATAAEPALAQLEHWRLSFGDHDAF